MADPSTYRPAPGQIPVDPGVYRFRDGEQRVIYVGKAKSLRSRLNSYFQDVAGLHPRTQQMVLTAESVDWTVVDTEVEALALEYTWIKEFDPRFNVKYRDDKSYPWLAVTVSEKIPRVMVMRGAQKQGVRYFGPYGHAWAIRDTVDTLLRVFPMRSCSAGVYRRAEIAGRPCLLGDIGKCVAPCVGRVNAEEHREVVDGFLSFMSGRTRPVIDHVTEQMRTAAANQEYERAAKYRDDLAALERVLEKQTVVLGDGTDADVFGFVDDPLEVAVQIFSVRGGRIRGQRGWIAEKEEEFEMPELVQRAIMTLYADSAASAIPRELLVPVLPADDDALTQLLRERRGGAVTIRVPRRGDKRSLLETVERNAGQTMNRHKITRSGDLTNRSRALEELQAALDLDEPPLRIECFDISHLQGNQTVGSMVVFEDGLPRLSEYRRFTVRGITNNDVASMAQVVTRRFSRYLAERDRPNDDAEPSQPRGFAYRPSLVVIDGGPTQVASAVHALADLGLSDIAVCGLAKRLEEIWLPDESEPVVLPRASEGLYLMQRIRDEAHRFAITHHRTRRGRAAVDSVLDGIAGIGPRRRVALVKHFGSVTKLRQASVEQLAKAPGIGPATAVAIHAALQSSVSTAGVDMATGEILEETQ